MRKTKLGKYTIEFYESSDELPIERWIQLQQQSIFAIHCGGDTDSFDKISAKAAAHYNQGDNESGARVMANLRQGYQLIKSGKHPGLNLYALQVRAIDDKVYPRKMTTTNIDDVLAVFSRLGVTASHAIQRGQEGLKEIADDLGAYRKDKQGNNVELTMALQRIRANTLAILAGVILGTSSQQEINEIDEKTIAQDPAPLASELELKLLKGFEEHCSALTTRISIDPRTLSTLSFYTTFDVLAKQKQ